MTALPTTFPRRVTTGPVRLLPNGNVSHRGTRHGFSMTRGQASYAMYKARKAAQESYAKCYQCRQAKHAPTDHTFRSISSAFGVTVS